ncbi:hypothetical protein RRG08_063387 [Elysia crispata]|uniref:Uncharacterized protein n=1 Tax=Elysia crispata TaxID=231223 RepID=A0AAE1E903_9GAST|nr:hypothetical protein RRG08_063387 [Elysia crispata]
MKPDDVRSLAWSDLPSSVEINNAEFHVRLYLYLVPDQLPIHRRCQCNGVAVGTNVSSVTPSSQQQVKLATAKVLLELSADSFAE